MYIKNIFVARDFTHFYKIAPCKWKTNELTQQKKFRRPNGHWGLGKNNDKSPTIW